MFLLYFLIFIKMLHSEIRIVLNDLSSRINKEYGYKTFKRWYIFKTRIPRINLGPCGPFAKLFHDMWNDFFKEKVTICFLFMTGKEYCLHCFVKLPTGEYFDGGAGLFVDVKSLGVWPSNTFIEEMKEYDEAKLEKNAFGLKRTYAECPSYSNEKVSEIIALHLKKLL